VVACSLTFDHMVAGWKSVMKWILLFGVLAFVTSGTFKAVMGPPRSWQQHRGSFDYDYADSKLVYVGSAVHYSKRGHHESSSMQWSFIDARGFEVIAFSHTVVDGDVVVVVNRSRLGAVFLSGGYLLCWVFLFYVLKIRLAKGN